MRQLLASRPPVGSTVELIGTSSYLYNYHGAVSGSVGKVKRYSRLNPEDTGLLVDWGDGKEVRMDLNELYLVSPPDTDKLMQQRIIDTMNEHLYNHRGKCECGVRTHEHNMDNPTQGVRAHLAEMLLPLLGEAEAQGWEAAKREIRSIPCWYTDEDHHGFDLWEDAHGDSQESGARISVMKILDNNPFKPKETP